MINTSTLSNGIRVITDSVETAESVSLGVWVSVGARYETKENNGISHMLEHMAFKGTTTRSAFEISKEIEDVGGYINAYTAKNMTAYYVRVLKENLDLGLNIIADIVQNSTMDPEELKKEKGVIIQEINMQNDTPDDLIFDYYAACAYPDQPIGRTILGTAESVLKIESQDLLNYIHSQYTTNRLIVSASGKVDHKSFVDACEKLFTNVPSHQTENALPAIYHGGDKRVNKPHEQVNLVLGFEGFSYHHSDYYAGSILASIIGGGMSSRLFQEIREKRGLVYSIYAFNSPQTDTGTFGIYAGTGEKEVVELMPVLCDELMRVSGSLTDEEISRAKAQLKASVLMQEENISSHARTNAVDLIIYGRLVPKEEVISKIEAVEKHQLEKIARQLFKQKPTFAALGPIQNIMSYEEITKRLQ